jgi:hypothetical protein
MRKRTKKMLVLFVVTVLVSCVLIGGANAYSFSTSVPSTSSVDFPHGDGSTYYVRTFYDYGTGLPFDDASAIATAGAKTWNARKVTAYLSDGSASTGVTTSCSLSRIGSGVQSIEVHPILTGHDYGTGYARAYTYDGYNSNGSDPSAGLTPVNYSLLTIN